MRITQIYTKDAIADIADTTGKRDVPVIEVLNPSNRMDMPIYTGTARNACNYLIPGVYDGIIYLGTFRTSCPIRVIVTETYSYATDTDGIAFSGRINA